MWQRAFAPTGLGDLHRKAGEDPASPQLFLERVDMNRQADRQTAYQNELARWQELFAPTDPAIQQVAEGLIEKAAYLHALCCELQQAIEVSGAIKVHPEHPDIQKQVPAVKEYARLSEAYAAIVHKLNNLRAKNVVEDDDELAEFE